MVIFSKAEDAGYFEISWLDACFSKVQLVKSNDWMTETRTIEHFVNFII